MQKYNVGDYGTTSKGFRYRVIATEAITTRVGLINTRAVGVVVKILNASPGVAYGGIIAMPVEDIATYYFHDDGSYLTSMAELNFGKLQPKKFKLKIKGYANFYPDQDIPYIYPSEAIAKAASSPPAIAVAVPVDFDVEV